MTQVIFLHLPHEKGTWNFDMRSHILFLVLDYHQPNPLFRSPIGDSPKVYIHHDLILPT